MHYFFFRNLLVVAVLLLAGAGATVWAQKGELQVEIQNPQRELLLTGREDSIEVDGAASVFGGLKELDMFIVLDSSQSLNRTDPKDFRTKAAIALVKALPVRSDIHLGLIEFSFNAHLLADLTDDRESIVDAMDDVQRDGGTNLAAGIQTAVDGFERMGRPDAARIVLLFTDGKSNPEKAIAAAQAARQNHVIVHTILLGDRAKSETLLRSIAETTDGSYVYTEDPEQLPQAFLDLRTTGVDHVKLSVNGSAPADTTFVAGTFVGNLPLREGRNRITATATDLEGNTAEDSVVVTVTGPLRVAIASPIDGSLYRELQTGTRVEISASLFGTPFDALRREFPRMGIAAVVLSAKGAPAISTDFVDGSFVADVPLELHGNRILATATSFDGRTAQAFVDVTVRPPGCSRLDVAARRNGKPAISLSDRGLEIIFDASNSMWGQMDGTPKITIAKDTLGQVMTGFPDDFFVALRVYGHQHKRELKNCTDSELLLALGIGNNEQIGAAIDGFKPRGMTPLAYSIDQLGQDFADFDGGRVAVLVTDGIESCGGDPVAAAQRVQQPGKALPINVIGFALSDSPDQALESLRSIATTSGGRFYLASNADELRDALMETAGTPFSIWQGTRKVAGGVLGVDRPIELEAGEYALRLEADKPQVFPFTAGEQQQLSLTLTRDSGGPIEIRQLTQERPWTLCTN